MDTGGWTLIEGGHGWKVDTDGGGIDEWTLLGGHY